MNAFHNGLYGRNTTEKQCNRLRRIPEITIPLKKKRA